MNYIKLYMNFLVLIMSTIFICTAPFLANTSWNGFQAGVFIIMDVTACAVAYLTIKNLDKI